MPKFQRWFSSSFVEVWIWMNNYVQQKIMLASISLLPWNVLMLTFFPSQLSGLALQWRHNERDGVSNHQPHDYLFNRLFRHTPKETSKLRVTDLCVGNSPVSGEFHAQWASDAENASIWWRHHGMGDSTYPSSGTGHVICKCVVESACFYVSVSVKNTSMSQSRHVTEVKSF